MVDLASQALVKIVVSDAIADGEKDVQAGKRFYFTARDRWSTERWEACGSCHPDGLTDSSARPHRATAFSRAAMDYHGPIFGPTMRSR